MGYHNIAPYLVGRVDLRSFVLVKRKTGRSLNYVRAERRLRKRLRPDSGRTTGPSQKGDGMHIYTHACNGNRFHNMHSRTGKTVPQPLHIDSINVPGRFFALAELLQNTGTDVGWNIRAGHAFSPRMGS